MLGALAASLLTSALGGCARGCGRGSLVEEPPPLEVALDPAWEGWSLPFGDGTVVFSNNRMLTVEYDAGTVQSLASSWVAAITTAGWTRAIDTSAEDAVSMSFVREEQTLALGVFPGLFGVTVTLTTYDTP